MKQLCVINVVLVSILIALLIVCLVVKHRAKINRFMKKKQVFRFVVNVIIPFAVPFAISILTIIWEGNAVSNELRWATIVLSCVASVNLAAQLGIWLKEKKESDLRWERMAAGRAFNNMFEIHKSKSSQLRTAYHNGLKHGMLTDADIPYNIFDQIRKITWEFCNTMSQITDIPTKDLEAAFIYRYAYKDAKGPDGDWRWVVGRGSRFDEKLSDFVNDKTSAFHYIINSNIASMFYNDKSEAEKEGHYKYSYKDDEYDRVGSFFAAKVAFSGNDQILCEGIIVINSYGKRFLDSIPGYTEKELSHMILDSIFPCFRYMLTTELAMLYFRHQDDEPETTDSKAEDTGTTEAAQGIKNSECCKAVKCIITASRKIWREQ